MQGFPGYARRVPSNTYGDVPKWLKGPDSKSGRRRKACGGSNPSISATSPQALYRLRRLFSTVTAPSFCCGSFPNRTRCAGLRFGYETKISGMEPLYSSEIPCLAQMPALRRGFLAGQGLSSLSAAIRCAGFAVNFGCELESWSIETVCAFQIRQSFD